MKIKNILYFILLAVGFIACAAFLIINTNEKVEPTTALIFTRDLDGSSSYASDRLIGENDVAEVTIPKGAVQGNFITDKKEVVGKNVNTYVYANTYIYSEQLTDEATDVFDELYSEYEVKHLRTVTVAFEIGHALAGNIKPGDRVDLLYCDSGQRVVDSSDYSSTEQTEFVYTEPFMSDVWVYKVNTSEGYLYEDYSQDAVSDVVDKEPLQYVTFIGPAQSMVEIQNRANKGTLAMMGRLAESENTTITGHVIGDYSKVFSGYVDVETGKLALENDTKAKASN